MSVEHNKNSHYRKNLFLRKWHKVLKNWQAFVRMVKRFLPYMRKQTKPLIMAQLMSLGYMLFRILEPWPLKLIFDNVFLGHPLPPVLNSFMSAVAGSPIILLNIFVGSIILIALVRGVFYYYQQLLTSRVGQQVTANIRVALYGHLQNLSSDFHDRRKTGDLIVRLTSDIRILRTVLISLPLTLTGELFLMIGMITVMFFMDWQLTLIALMVIPTLALLLRKYQRPMKMAIRKQREREGHLSSIASEVLGAIKVVKGFHRESDEIKRFDSENKSSLRSGLRAARLEAKFRWASELAVAVVLALVIGVAARRVLTGAMTPGDVLVFVAYMRAYNRPLRRISRVTERLARGTASGERIWDLMNISPNIKDLPKAIDAKKLKGNIWFDDVGFGYQKKSPVLFDINLKIDQGQRVAVVGPTGCGKSTLVSLLPRFYDPQKGRVCIDGRDIREFTLLSLRQNISIVFQEPILFATTIAENIAYGKPNADFKEIKEAATQSGIHHIIEALPDGYETTLGERGGTLSGGQRNCVAIARAIIRDTPIVILDEPTVGLDHQSMDLVTNALRRLMTHKTVFIITHHLKDIWDVDHVVTLQKGRIINQGQSVLSHHKNWLGEEIQHVQTESIG